MNHRAKRTYYCSWKCEEFRGIGGGGRGGVLCIGSVVWDCMVNEMQRLFPKNLLLRGRTDHQQFISMTG